jgi:hypothetical protein
MQLGTPFNALHEAISAAVHRDLPDMNYEDRDWAAWQKLSKEDQAHAMKTNSVPKVKKTRRPMSDELEVVMFPQTWASTALGYGGIGGCAMTPAYTVIVTHHNCSCVYFGYGRLAYTLNYSMMSPEGMKNARADIASQNMAEVSKAGKYR